MARSEDHQHERDDKDDKKEAPARLAKSDAVTHEELDAFAEKLMERVRQEIALAASGVPLEDRVARNT